ncbi:MAG: AMP-binding protein [Muribaculaceae bacterium]|nr:AMP-binding protein [Muribaculaceae bacterium]
MIERFTNRTDFESYADFAANFRLTIPRDFNFAYDVVDVWAAEEPSREALLWTNPEGEERRFTFADMKELSDQTASFFQSLGVGKGTRVMLMLKRHWQFWPAMMALHKLGAVAIPATHLLTAEDIEYRCRMADIKVIVAAGDPDMVEHIDEARPRCKSLEWLVSTGPCVPAGWLDFNKGVDGAPAFRRPEKVNSNSDVMLLYFTSGTSGEPKMVAHDFTYPLGHIVTARFWHNLRPGDIHLTLADTGWGKAVWGKLYGQWICGADVFVYDFDKFVPKDLLGIMEKYRINSFCAPPTVFRFLIREDVKAFDLSALDRCTIAGEALNPSVFEKWKELTGISLREGFGQTETTLTVGTFPWVEPRPGSMGLPNPLYGIDIVDEDGNPVEDNVNGEIVIRADRDGVKPAGLFREYLDDEELTANAWHDGLYHTGDIAWRDKDGYLWFVSRKDDVIKSSGYRIGPFEVESACLTHPAVVECAITAVPDDVRGQIVKATIVLAADYVQQAGADLVKDIQNHVKRITAPYKYPRVIEFVKELPKTISGKIRRVAIRASDAANSALQAAKPAPGGKGIIHA